MHPCVCALGEGITLFTLSLAVAFGGRWAPAAPSVDEVLAQVSEARGRAEQMGGSGSPGPGPHLQSSDPKVPQGYHGSELLLINTSVHLRSNSLPRDKAPGLLTETSRLCFWLELYQLSVITQLISCGSEPLIGSHTQL